MCVNRARRFQVKKFIRTSYNMIDELADHSIVNNKIIIERIYNFLIVRPFNLLHR